MGILDVVSDSKRGSLEHDFSPFILAEKILNLLKERDRVIIAKRHGLLNHNKSTLEAIGSELKLTRERVRQIEKNIITELKKQVKSLEEFQKHADLVHHTVSSHGGLMAEIDLLESLGVKAVAEANTLRFILLLVEGLEEVKDSKHSKDGWKTFGFDEDLYKKFLNSVYQTLETHAKPKSADDLLGLVKETELFQNYSTQLTDQVVKNFLAAAKQLDKNPLNEYGLSHWPEVRPRDVGDKAFLALRHHKVPAHYAEITDIINNLKFGGRKAHPETVHNELIKDPRFVLIGRGIYALAEWGYKPGVVTDVIVEVLKENNGGPMNRDALLEEVMKRRIVKRNTVLVSLSNKSVFEKHGRNQYALVNK